MTNIEETNRMLSIMRTNVTALSVAIQDAGGSPTNNLCNINDFLIMLARNNICLTARYVESE